ncbi:MAG: hypothetical protein QXO51_00120 [Halobacteria archaeon]
MAAEIPPRKTYGQPTPEDRHLHRGSGAAAWLFQRVSGIALIGLVGLHFWLVHFADLEGAWSVKAIADMHIKQLSILAVDYALLGFALAHGLSGVRNILVDMKLWPGGERTIRDALSAVGIATFVYGTFAFWPFLTYAGP